MSVVDRLKELYGHVAFNFDVDWLTEHPTNQIKHGPNLAGKLSTNNHGRPYQGITPDRQIARFNAGNFFDVERSIPQGEKSMRFILRFYDNNGQSTYPTIFDQRGWTNAGSGWVISVSRYTTDLWLAHYNNQVTRITASITGLEVGRWYDILATYKDGELNVYLLRESDAPVARSVTTNLNELQSNVSTRFALDQHSSNIGHFELSDFEVYTKALHPRDFAEGVMYLKNGLNIVSPYYGKLLVFSSEDIDAIKYAARAVYHLDTVEGIDLTESYTTITAVSGAGNISDGYITHEFTKFNVEGSLTGIARAHFVRHGGQYKYFSPTSGWLSLGDTLDLTTLDPVIVETVVNEDGTTTDIYESAEYMPDLSAIPQSVWGLLTGEKSLIRVQEGQADTYELLEQTVDPITLADRLGAEYELRYISFEEGDACSVVTYDADRTLDFDENTAEVKIFDHVEGSYLVELHKGKQNIYSTFDSEVTLAKLDADIPSDPDDFVLTANYTPLDELEGDFDFVVATKDGIEPGAVVKGAHNQAHFISEINVAPYHLKAAAAQIREFNENAQVRFAFTRDNFSFKIARGGIEKTLFKIDAVYTDGLTYEELFEMTESELKNITADGYRIAATIGTDVRDYSKSGIYNITVTQDIPVDTPRLADLKIGIINAATQLNINFLGSLLSGKLDDADGGLVKYQVELNGEHYYPSVDEWTEFMETPRPVFVQLSSDDVTIDGPNTLIIRAEDYFGNKYEKVYDFIGEYSGLLFRDPKNGYYTTDIGEIVKLLEVGVLQQGQTSQQYEVHLINNNPFSVENTTLIGEANSLGLAVELSKSGMPFITESPVKWEDVIKYKEVKSFYVRLRAGKDAEIRQDGKFVITAEAEMVEE